MFGIHYHGVLQANTLRKLDRQPQREYQQILADALALHGLVYRQPADAQDMGAGWRGFCCPVVAPQRLVWR